MTSPLVIHAICVALVIANLIVRTWRTQVIFAGLGRPIAFADVATANLAGDTAAALTPLRVGGIPAQVAFFQRIGTAPQVAVPVLLVESLLLYPVYAVIGGVLALSAGLEWFELLKTAGTTAGRFAQTIGGLFVVGWLLILIARRAAPGRTRMVGRSIGDGIALMRGMGMGPALLTAPLTVADVATRLVLLPLLALNVPGAPATDVLAIASFAMLYGQIAMPTPGGAGIVDLGLIGGAAGDLGGGASSIVLSWRIYTAGLHILACGPMLWWRLSSRVRRQRAAYEASRPAERPNEAPEAAPADETADETDDERGARSDSPRAFARRVRMGSRNR